MISLCASPPAGLHTHFSGGPECIFPSLSPQEIPEWELEPCLLEPERKEGRVEEGIRNKENLELKKEVMPLKQHSLHTHTPSPEGL